MPHQLILNRGDSEQIVDFDSIEQAFDAAEPWIMEGYAARMTDKNGTVQYTQVLQRGVIATFRGDALNQPQTSDNTWGRTTSQRMPKPWWKFW